jgi:hypothetical protein
VNSFRFYVQCASEEVRSRLSCRVGMLWNVGCTKVLYITNIIRCREIMADRAGGHEMGSDPLCYG